MAEGIFRQLAQRGGAVVAIKSAGLGAIEGQSATAHAIAACREIGVDLTAHRAHRLTGEDLLWADLIVTVSPTHAYIVQRAGAPAEKIYCLGDIRDPFEQGLETYRRCRDELKAALVPLLERVRQL